MAHLLSVDYCTSWGELDPLESFFLEGLQRLVVEHTEFRVSLTKELNLLSGFLLLARLAHCPEVVLLEGAKMVQI